MIRRTVHHMVAGAGKAACIEVPAHPHQLRRGCGFYLANKVTILAQFSNTSGIRTFNT
jgi:hypothetical protein